MRLMGALLLSFMLLALNAQAQQRVYVRGYTRSDGTYVAPYTRSAPGTASSTYSVPRGRSTYTPAAAPSYPYASTDPVPQRQVYVRGYTRSDGTYVAPYYRSAPLIKPTYQQPAAPSYYPYATPAPRSRTVTGASPYGTPSATWSTRGYTTATGANPPRDSRGRIRRSSAARHQFLDQTGYPNGRPGYVVDHVVPLACGGADAPSNMQWQTVAQAQAKDAWERVGCQR